MDHGGPAGQGVIEGNGPILRRLRHALDDDDACAACGSPDVPKGLGPGPVLCDRCNADYEAAGGAQKFGAYHARGARGRFRRHRVTGYFADDARWAMEVPHALVPGVVQGILRDRHFGGGIAVDGNPVQRRGSGWWITYADGSGVGIG